MDKWKRKDLKQLEFGGNKKAREFYDKNGTYENGKPNHKAPEVNKWRADLAKEAEKSLNMSFS